MVYMKNAILKDTFREIRGSLSKFFLFNELYQYDVSIDFVVFYWCRRWESNPHEVLSLTGF